MKRGRTLHRTLALGAAFVLPFLLSSCHLAPHADGCETAAVVTADFVLCIFGAIGLAALAIIGLAYASQ